MAESANLRPDPAPDPAAALLAIVDWLVAESRPGFESCAALDGSLERDLGRDSLAPAFARQNR